MQRAILVDRTARIAFALIVVAPPFLGGCDPKVDGESCLRLTESALYEEELPLVVEGNPYSPQARLEDGKLALYVTSIVFGGGGDGVSMWRFESDDGVSFRNGAELPGSRDWGSALTGSAPVRVGDVDYMAYRTTEDQTLPGSKTRIGIASSTAGGVWVDTGIVYEGSGTAIDDVAMLEPVLFHDGVRFHLYYAAWSDECDGDECERTSRVGHATSEDGTAFTFNGTVSPQQCADVERSAFLTGTLVSACPAECGAASISLVVHQRPCDGGSSQQFLLSSDDGQEFTSTSLGPSDASPGDSLVIDRTTLVGYRHDSSELVMRATTQPAPALACEE